MSTEAEKRAVKKYHQKLKSVTIRYTEKEISEYNRLQDYLSENNIKVTEYLKNLIKADLDQRGSWVWERAGTEPEWMQGKVDY